MSAAIHPNWTAPRRPQHPNANRANLAAADDRPPTPPDDGDPLEGLAPVLRAVAILASQGRSNREVGAILGIAEGTVKNHMNRIFRRLGLTGSATSPSRRLAYLIGYQDGLRAAKDGPS